MSSPFPQLDGLRADAVGVARDGSGAAVLYEGRVNAVGPNGPWVFGLPARGADPGTQTGVVFGSEGLLVLAGGQVAWLDHRTGACRGVSRANGLVKRGLLGGRGVLEVDGGYVVRSLETGEDALVIRVEVPFMGSLSAAVVGPSGRVLAVGGSEGMDAGWTDRFDLATGESLGRSGSGYAIDAVELDAHDALLGIDDYIGLFGWPGEGEGTELWVAGSGLFVVRRDGVRHLARGGTRHWAVQWPHGIAVDDDGEKVGVVVSGVARFVGTEAFDASGG